MDFTLFDSHCHLYMPQFDEDREAVLSRMQATHMGAVVIGVDLETSRKALELAEAHDFLWASVGLHPNDNPTEEFVMERYEALARNSRVVAIGECGLDYFRSGGTPEEKLAQKVRFEKHVELACLVQKTLIIHCRNAHDDMLEILTAHKAKLTAAAVKVVIHFMTGTGELAQKYLDLGCYLSFPGPITYTDMYDDSVRATPLERLLIETDSPYAAPVPNRGKRNEPSFVAGVAQKVALLKDISAHEAEEASARNAQIVFGLT